MILRSDIKRRVKPLAIQLLGACLAGYFVYHAVEGERGLLAWLRVHHELRAAEEELQQTGADRLALERRVAQLNSSSLDPDMLDERARAMLNFSHPDDVVIFTGQIGRQSDENGTSGESDN
jgi:cell division protein FtsB